MNSPPLSSTRRRSLGERCYIDPAASVIGDVVLGEDVSIWPGTIVRGDVNFIRIVRTHQHPGRQRRACEP
jgi:carbonic anhydrase/acetyltransferase-like protein (isoleucine patch superfamily)